MVTCLWWLCNWPRYWHCGSAAAGGSLDTDSLKEIESKLSVLCYVDYNYRFKGM